MNPMTPPEFEHSAAAEVFEDYEQYLDHHRAKSEGRTASATTLISANYDFQTWFTVGILLGCALVTVYEDSYTFR